MSGCPGDGVERPQDGSGREDKNPAHGARRHRCNHSLDARLGARDHLYIAAADDVDTRLAWRQLEGDGMEGVTPAALALGSRRKAQICTGDTEAGDALA